MHAATRALQSARSSSIAEGRRGPPGRRPRRPRRATAVRSRKASRAEALATSASPGRAPPRRAAALARRGDLAGDEAVEGPQGLCGVERLTEGPRPPSPYRPPVTSGFPRGRESDARRDGGGLIVHPEPRGARISLRTVSGSRAAMQRSRMRSAAFRARGGDAGARRVRRRGDEGRLVVGHERGFRDLDRPLTDFSGPPPRKGRAGSGLWRRRHHRAQQEATLEDEGRRSPRRASSAAAPFERWMRKRSASKVAERERRAAWLMRRPPPATSRIHDERNASYPSPVADRMAASMSFAARAPRGDRGAARASNVFRSARRGRARGDREVGVELRGGAPRELRRELLRGAPVSPLLPLGDPLLEPARGSWRWVCGRHAVRQPRA